MSESGSAWEWDNPTLAPLQPLDPPEKPSTSVTTIETVLPGPPSTHTHSIVSTSSHGSGLGTARPPPDPPEKPSTSVTTIETVLPGPGTPLRLLLRSIRLWTMAGRLPLLSKNHLRRGRGRR
jgi:hypothetical protein